MSEVLCGACFASSPPGEVCTHCGTKLAGRGWAAALPVGTLLDGKFVVGHVLGSPGGFGIAYLGWDRVLQRKVVIKELFPDQLVRRVPGSAAVDAIDSRRRNYFNQQRELFLDEARKLARLDGVDAVARVIHYFAQNDTAYFVMPHVPGQSLASRVAQAGRLPVEQVLQWLWPLAGGLRSIHDLGLVHRDVKPENVLIDERERPVLIDFGNARVLDAGATTHDFFAVSRSFAAPEQYENDLERTGPWTDVYALGALLYFCLAGQRPTDAQLRATGQPVVPLEGLVQDLPPLLLQAVDRAMALDPTERPPTIDALLAMLEPLRPQPFAWTQALPEGDFGERLRRVHDQVAKGFAAPRGFNAAAGVLQFFWFFAHRLFWPGVASSLFLLAAAGIGLWWRVLPFVLPLAWLLAVLPCAMYGDWLLYRRVATLGNSLPLVGQAQQQHARKLLAAAGTADARTMLLGFVPLLAGIGLWGAVVDYEEDVRYRVRQAAALDELRARVAAYIAENKVPPQSLQDVGTRFVADSELNHLELKGGVIEVVLAVRGAAGRRLRWRLDPDQGWVCEARDLPPQYTPAGCRPAQ